jgi:hypothetical protein
MATWKRVITTSDDAAYKNSNVVAADISDVEAFSQSGNYASLRAQSTTKTDVGLGNVPNTAIAYSSAIPEGNSGLVPAAGASGYFLKSDGTWALPAYSSGALATEDVQDIVGAMFTGNTETNTTVTYQDVDGTIDVVSTDTTYANLAALDSTADTKLGTIETSADVTDATNVTAAGALMDSELTAIASVKALDQGVATGDSPTFAGLTVTGEFVASAGTVTLNGQVEIEDDFIVLNSDYASAAAVDAGITVEMGTTLNNVSLYQDASADNWKIGFQSGDLQIATTENGAVATTVAAAASEANGIGSMFVDTTNTACYIYF